jgi:hypothetical protein
MYKHFLFTLVFCSTMHLSAWWDTGHEMICSEAYKLLSQETKKTIDPLLQGQETFGLSCLWADEIKQERRDTRAWHYINLTDDMQNTYDARCPENGCLIKAFYDQLEVLKNKNAVFAERQEALWFIGHFVGDIHQPMHVGYPEDLGGNRHQLKLENGAKTNMHKVWDGQIIEHIESKIGEDGFRIQVQEKIKLFVDQAQSSHIEDWAQESRNIAMQDSVGYRGNLLKVASSEYMNANGEIVQDRIALGAIRLSALLNSIFNNGN